MALVHDLAEGIVGDITPHDGVTKEDKYKMESEAMEEIRTMVPAEVGDEFISLWQEYEEGRSIEALIVKDLDKFDMIFQAYEYEKLDERPGALEEFFKSTEGKFTHPMVKEWVMQLMDIRSQNNKLN